MKDKGNKWLYWIPRIFLIVFILFISIFALDVFDENLGFWGTILGLIIHLIPTWILILVLIFAWNFEKIGGLILILISLFFVVTYILRGVWYYSFIIALPIFIIGLLFLINVRKKK